MKKKPQPGFFDEERRLERISKLGDPLERLDTAIDWNIFRPILNRSLQKPAKGPGGRPPYDYVLMFKILVLQEYYGLSDHQTEFQITDRYSFMRFLGLRSYHDVPDQNTIWTFRERLTEQDVVKKLFIRFRKELDKFGMIVNEGKIIDATIVEVPKQRNTREENQEIKEGCVPEEWQKQPHKLRQKDVDATWTKKNKRTFFGYKNHIKADGKSKCIDDYVVTDASTHDSIAGVELLTKDDEGQTLHADRAYAGKTFLDAVEAVEMKNRVQEKGKRNHPLTAREKKRNKTKSKFRGRVEHLFAEMKKHGKSFMVRTVGFVRANIKIGMMNLTYNLNRYALYVQMEWV